MAREQGWPTLPPGFPASWSSATSTSSLGESWIEITRPQGNESYFLDPLIPDAQEKIVLEAHASPDLKTGDWFIDDRRIGSAPSPDFQLKWQPAPGKHVILIRSGNVSARVTIDVSQ